jgi:hypothetical protein
MTLPRSLSRVFVQQAIQRKYAAFAVVLGPQHQRRVFDGDDENDRPDRQRNRA